MSAARGRAAARAVSFLLAGGATLCLFGCEPLFSRDALSKVFNGVPAIPRQEEVCQAYVEKLVLAQGAAAAPAGEQKGEEQKAEEGSKHLPFAERRCKDCHAAEGQVSNALLKPKDELCFLCHKDLLKGDFTHGPAGTGDCLTCHEPHESAHKALLKQGRQKVCDTCHEERRAAKAMHDRLAAHNLACPDCHDPHSGVSRYFLK